MGSLDAGLWPGAGGARSARDARSAIALDVGCVPGGPSGNDDDDDLFSFLELRWRLGWGLGRGRGWDDLTASGIVGEEGSPMDGEEPDCWC